MDPPLVVLKKIKHDSYILGRTEKYCHDSISKALKFEQQTKTSQLKLHNLNWRGTPLQNVNHYTINHCFTEIKYKIGNRQTSSTEQMQLNLLSINSLYIETLVYVDVKG